MNELIYLAAGAAGAGGVVEAFIRFDARLRLANLATVCRKAGRVLMSSRISDHWKERAIPAYSAATLRASSIVALHIAAALIIFAAIACFVAFVLRAPPIGEDVLLDWPLNAGALVGGSLYGWLRLRSAG